MKSSKLRVISGLILILFLGFINYVFADTFDYRNEEAMIVAFEKTGGKLDKINLTYNGEILDKSMNLEELNNTYKNIKTIEGFKEIKRKHIDEETNKKLTIYGKDNKEREITIILDSNENKTTLIIDIVQKQGKEELKEIASSLENIFSNFNSNPQVTSCVIGKINAKLDKDNRIKVINDIMKTLDAAQIERLEEESLTSISAYTPFIKRHIFTGNKKMNLQVATRYNEYEGKTYVFIGSPIITFGY